MTRKQTRLTLILARLGLLGLAVGLMSYAFRSNIQFFCTPSDFVEEGSCSSAAKAGHRMRLGGLVENGSLVKGADGQVTFNITDHTKTMQVTYKDLLPDLFREGQGVVAEGVTAADGSFKADVILAKHDEKYMPKEVVEKLKAQGQWRPE